MIYRQIIGIPMGIDCAPHIANLFLFAYEYEYVSNQMLKKAPNLHVFKYCSRYLDDLNIPNAGNDMDKIICNDIYPRELTVLNTNPSEPSSCTYLDLDIVVENGKFTTKLYDKRKAFSFKVVTFPNLKSNIPSKQA